MAISKFSKQAKMAEFAAQFAPEEPKRQNKIKITLRADPKLLELIDQSAARMSIPRSAWLHLAALEYLKKEQP